LKPADKKIVVLPQMILGKNSFNERMRKSMPLKESDEIGVL